MKARSAKAKGRRFQKEIYELLMKHFDNVLQEGDLKPSLMSEQGEDIKKSPAAIKVFPYSVECKSQEKLNIWSALKQAEENCPTGQTPLVAFKKNRSNIYVALKFEEFLKLLKN